MYWRRTGDKPLFGPMMAYFTDAYMRPLDLISYEAKHTLPLEWRHNEWYSLSNHRRLGCLFNRLLRHRSKKYQSFASLDFVRGIRRISLTRASNAENFPYTWCLHNASDSRWTPEQVHVTSPVAHCWLGTPRNWTFATITFSQMLIFQMSCAHNGLFGCCNKEIWIMAARVWHIPLLI